MVAAAIHPTGEGDGLADIGGAQGACGAGSQHGAGFLPCGALSRCPSGRTARRAGAVFDPMPGALSARRGFCQGDQTNMPKARAYGGSADSPAASLRWLTTMIVASRTSRNVGRKSEAPNKGKAGVSTSTAGG